MFDARVDAAPAGDGYRAGKAADGDGEEPTCSAAITELTAAVIAPARDGAVGAHSTGDSRCDGGID